MTLAPEGGRTDATAVPLVGRIAAGAPVLAAEHVEEYVSVPADYARGPGDHFALRVAGDSMIDAGILDGDVVVVHQQDAARDGDIVAALLPGSGRGRGHREAPRPRRRTGRCSIPENPAYDPIEMPDGRIMGKVVAVLRKL